MGGTHTSKRSSVVSSSSSSAVSWPFLFAADNPRRESKTVKSPGKATTLVSNHKSAGRSVKTVVVESSAPVKLWPFFMQFGGSGTSTKSNSNKQYYEAEPRKRKKKRSSPKELETQVFPFFAQVLVMLMMVGVDIEKRKVLFVKERDEYHTY